VRLVCQTQSLSVARCKVKCLGAIRRWVTSERHVEKAKDDVAEGTKFRLVGGHW